MKEVACGVVGHGEGEGLGTGYRGVGEVAECRVQGTGF